MIFSYRTRQFLKRLFVVLVYIALAAVALAFCLLLWLQRFIVYTPDGAKLMFDLPAVTAPGATPQAPQNGKVDIEYVGEEKEEIPDDPTVEVPKKEKMKGYYIEPQLLQQKDLTEVYSLLEALPAGTPVMLDVKSTGGYFFYSSEFGSTSTAYDIAQMDALIAYLAESELYVIAKLPGLCDYDYAVKHPLCGIQDKRGYVWLDSSRKYWLDPSKERTMTYLIQVIKELRGLGFDEVVLQNFSIPESENIDFKLERQPLLNETAQSLVLACATEEFTVAFVADTPALQMPESRSRLYLMNVPGADVEEMLSQMLVNDPETDVVIIAQSYDTRYEICGTLHPLSQAH